MPAGLWHQVEQRFGPAVVLELYASTRSDAILGNVSGRKVGAAGRPLPGTPKVRVVAYDEATRRPLTGDDGYAVECEPGEIGLLLVECPPGRLGGNDLPLRGMFAPDDAWVSTGDLFRADRDGDLWLVDSLAALIATDHGLLSPRTVEHALGALDAVDLVACYPAIDPAGGSTVARAAVTLRGTHELTAASLDRALRGLEPGLRPDEVHVIDDMPTTSWFRPSVHALQTRRSTAAEPSWRLDRRTGTYQ
jgi:putative long chain acyl-CoA synthase